MTSLKRAVRGQDGAAWPGAGPSRFMTVQLFLPHTTCSWGLWSWCAHSGRKATAPTIGRAVWTFCIQAQEGLLLDGIPLTKASPSSVPGWEREAQVYLVPRRRSSRWCTVPSADITEPAHVEVYWKCIFQDTQF